MLPAMSDENRPVKITLTGKLNYADDITVSQAAQIVAFIDSSAAAPGAISFKPGQAGLISSQGNAGISNPRDALEVSGAKTNPERIVAFALYVAQAGDKDAFTLEDVKPLFRRARERSPGNITRDLDVAIKSGWVAESDITGEFYVTGKAAKVLENGFESIRGGARAASTSSRNSGPKKARKTNGSVPPAFSGIDTISASIDGQLDYHKVKTKVTKLLWAVNAAKIHGVPSVDTKEIVWLTDRLGDCISGRDVSAYYKRNFQRGYVNRSNQDDKIRITPSGEEYLRSLKAGGDGG
jgi:hypothetical protein